MSSTVEVVTRSELGELLELVHRDDLAGLEEQGYMLRGGVRYTFSGFSGRAILMLGPVRDRAASIVPTTFVTVFAIGSTSIEMRRLVSRQGSFGQPPPWELCNDLPGASPRQLDEAHSDALVQVQEFFEPAIRAEDETLEEMAAAMEKGLRSIEVLGLDHLRSTGFGKLTNDAYSARRIERWMSAEPPQ